MSMMEQNRRLDTELVLRKLTSGREKAKEHIRNGMVQVNGKTASKASMMVSDTDEITCENRERYVGRGGYKLEKAMKIANLQLDGVCAMDVGASTGGFTDCMLQNGAQQVYAVDVGHGQLHPRLKEDPRVVNIEGIDIRNSDTINKIIDKSSVQLCTIDVSFISVRKLFQTILSYLEPGATVVCLIKPQFEAGRSAVGKNGVVKDKNVHRTVLKEMCLFLSEQNCTIEKLDYSPITGGEGNIEYLAILTYDKENNQQQKHSLPIDIDRVVKLAHVTLKDTK